MIKRTLIFLIIVCSCAITMADNTYKWALYDVKGTGEFHDGLAEFYSNGLYGFINYAGEVAIEAKFKSVEDFEDGQAIVETESGIGIINRNGLFLLEPKYKRIEKAKEAPGLYVIENAEGYKGIFFNNRLVIPPINSHGDFYTYNFPFINNINILSGKQYAGTIKKEGDIFVIWNLTEKGQNNLYFDKNGNELNAISYRKSSKGLVLFKGENDKYGLKNADTGTIVTAPQYTGSSFDIWIKDHIIVFTSKGFALIDANGEKVIETGQLDYEGNYILSLTFEPKIQHGLYSLTGEEIIPTKYNFIFNIVDDWYCCESDDGKIALNIKTKKKYSGKYFTYSDGMIQVAQKDGGYYYINAVTGNRLADTYKYANDFSEGLAIVEKNGDGYKRIIDKQGKTILRETEDFEIEGDIFSEGVIATRYKHGYCYMYNPLGHGDYVYNQKGATNKTIDIWFKEGLEAMNKKRYSEAKEIFYRIIMNAPNNGMAINNYGVCLDNMGYKEEALEAFTMAFDLNPDNKLAKNNMELTKNELLQQQEQTENETEESNSGTFWDALASFGNLLGQMAGNYAGQNADNSYSSDYSGQNNSSSSNSSASYQTEYSRWESIAERHYNSITNTGFRVRDKQGNRGGGAMQGMNSGNYVQMKKSFRDAQRQMRNIRSNAQRHGVTITQSKWETATIAY